MNLAQNINIFAQVMLARYKERVHKIAIDAGLTCPNRDGSIGLAAAHSAIMSTVQNK